MIRTDFEFCACFADMPAMLRLWRRASLWLNPSHAVMTPRSQRSQNHLKLTSTLTVTFEPR